MNQPTSQNAHKHHQAEEHGSKAPPTEKKIRCETCGNLYASRKSLKIHYRIHTGDKPYACHLCPKRFTQTNVLKAHLNFHAGRRDWICTHCNKAFTQSAHLRTHLKTHSTIQKDYECPHCAKRFSSKERRSLICQRANRSSELPVQKEVCETWWRMSGVRDRHQRQHTGEKPYKCTVCAKKFTRTESLKHHINSHKGIRPFTCPYKECNKRFTKKSSLRRHCRFARHSDTDDIIIIANTDQHSPKSLLSQSSTDSSMGNASVIPESPLMIKTEEMDENDIDETSIYRNIVKRLTDAQLERLEGYLELALDEVILDEESYAGKPTQAKSFWVTSQDRVHARNPFADNEELSAAGGRTIAEPVVLSHNALGVSKCHNPSHYAMYNGNLLEGHLLDSVGSVPVGNSSCRYNASLPCFDGPPTYYSFN